MQMQYNQQNTQDRNEPVDTVIAAVDRKYLIPSGIITMKVDAMGMTPNMVSTVYFDRYGNRECTETKNSMDMGNGNVQNSHSMSFNSNGFLYNVDLIKRTCVKTKYNPKVMTGGFSFAGLTDNLKKKFNVKKEGTAVVLGKECDKYSMNSPDMKGEFCVWKNLTLNLTSKTGAFVTKITTTKLEENVPIPKDKFTVPADVKITTR